MEDYLKFPNMASNFQKSRIGLFTVLLTLCPCSSHSSLYSSSFLLTPTFIFVVLIFSVSRKLNGFSFLLDFCHFFGLQFVSFNIRQYCEFASKPFSKFPLISIFCMFFSALVLFLSNFLPSNFILLFCLFYDLVFEKV